MSTHLRQFADLAARWRWSSRNAALAALAAGLAWWFAVWMTADPRPVSAAVVVVVALAPGIANPRLQLVGLLVGFTTGLVIGALARPLIDAEPMVMIVPITFFAIVAASSFGRNPIILIQSGASAVLAVGGVTANTGWTQFLDVLAAAGVASAFSQILFVPDPVLLLDQAAREIVDEAERVATLGIEDRRGAWDDVERVAAKFGQAVATARGVRRWTLRGRLGAARIAAAERRWLIPARRLSAAAAMATCCDDEHVRRELRSAIAVVRTMRQQ